MPEMLKNPLLRELIGVGCRILRTSGSHHGKNPQDGPPPHKIPKNCINSSSFGVISFQPDFILKSKFLSFIFKKKTVVPENNM
jgi:peptide methionine sulfoxide reductase MsrB